MKNSIGKMLHEVFTTFRKSFLAIFCTYLCLIIIILLSGFLAAITFGREIATLIGTLYMNPGFAIDSMMPQLIILLIVIFIIFALFYFVGLWLFLIIKNNALIGKNLTVEALKESGRKFWKVLLWGVIIFIGFIVLNIFSSILLNKYAFLLVLPISLLLTPFIFTVSFGMMCQNDGFFKTITDGFSLALHKWGKILLTYIVYIILALIIIVPVGWLQAAVIHSGHQIIGRIFGAAFNFLVLSFSYCFFTVYYLNIAELIGKDETEEE